jgi:DNA-binding NtrC family response regulator
MTTVHPVQLRVLVAEDESLLRWSIAEYLRRGGHTVIEAGSAGTVRQALLAATEPIDVVMLDLRLPDSSDLRLLEEIRRRMPRSAVVLMTAYGTPEVIQAARERGVYCVVNKPFDLDDLEPLIRSAFQSARYH